MQLITFFQLLIDTFFLCHLCYKQIALIASLIINVCEVSVQLLAETKIGIRYCVVLLEVIQVRPIPDTDRTLLLSEMYFFMS